MVGALYPFPLLEDGDFDIPSVYMTEEEGNRLAEHVGKEISLESRVYRIPATGCNVIARKGVRPNRRDFSLQRAAIRGIRRIAAGSQ